MNTCSKCINSSDVSCHSFLLFKNFSCYISFSHIRNSIVFFPYFNILFAWLTKNPRSLSSMTPSSIVVEGSDSWPSWLRHSVQISYLGFSRRGVLILESSVSRGIWSHSVGQFLLSDSAMRCSNPDFSTEHNSSQSMISWYFLGIVSMPWGIFQKLPKKSTIVIPLRGIFLIFESDICLVSRDGSIV